MMTRAEITQRVTRVMIMNVPGATVNGQLTFALKRAVDEIVETWVRDKADAVRVVSGTEPQLLTCGCPEQVVLDAGHQEGCSSNGGESDVERLTPHGGCNWAGCTICFPPKPSGDPVVSKIVKKLYGDEG